MPAGAAAPFFWGALAGTAGAVGSSAIQSRSAGNSARTQERMATQAAELEAQAAREALAFEKEREERRRAEFERIQALNEGIYKQTRKDLQPYRQLGRGSIGQMMKPIPRQSAGSIGSLMEGQ